jgi:hypothetical protein
VGSSARNRIPPVALQANSNIKALYEVIGGECRVHKEIRYGNLQEVLEEIRIILLSDSVLIIVVERSRDITIFEDTVELECFTVKYDIQRAEALFLCDCRWVLLLTTVIALL